MNYFELGKGESLTFVWLSERRRHCSSHTQDFARRRRLQVQAATKNPLVLRAEFGVISEPKQLLDFSCTKYC